MNAAPACQRHFRHAVSRLHRHWHVASTVVVLRRTHKPYSTTTPQLTNVSEKEINAARAYCINLLRQHDGPSHTLRPFIPAPAQDAYLSLRALNIDTARIADATSSPTVGALRMQFWRDAVTRSLSLSPPKEPVAVLLASAAASLAARTGGKARFSKAWLLRIINTRDQHLHNPPFRDLAALETYAENTYSTLLYLTLSALPLASITADHVASHIGKAQGIAAVLRGLPYLAFPRPPATHSPQNALGGALPGSGRQGFVPLPLDVMAECGVREEKVFREGAAAEGLRDAVFKVATRANDHLITAREMVANVKRGEGEGHEFEYMDDPEHGRGAGGGEPEASLGQSSKSSSSNDISLALGVLMPAISTQLFLDRLQACDFNVFDPKLQRRGGGGDWKLPWRAYWGFRGGRL